MRQTGLTVKALYILLSLLLIFASLVSCRPADTTGTPDALVKNWLEAWKAMDLDRMLKMTADSYKDEVQRFYSNEFKAYAKLDYQNLKLQVLKQTSDEATVQATFIAILESSSNPIFGEPSMVTQSSVVHLYELVREGNSWLVKSITRQPGS